MGSQVDTHKFNFIKKDFFKILSQKLILAFKIQFNQAIFI